MASNLVISALVIVVFGFLWVSAIPQKRVIEGSHVRPKSFPASVSLKDPSGDCGSTIIAPQWLVTAAHCFLTESSNKMDVGLWDGQAGSPDIVYDPRDIDKEGHENHIRHLKLSKIILHPKYKKGVYDYDIAMVKLTKPLDINSNPSIEKMDLPNHSVGTSWPPVGAKCTVVGWGCEEDDGVATPDEQEGILPVQSREDCNSYYEDFAGYNPGILPDSEICVGNFDGDGAAICPGDSGSGLYCKDSSNKWKLAGVVSAGNLEEPSMYPGVFTRVSYFRNWIDKIIATE